jgi:hypothetical protein
MSSQSSLVISWQRIYKSQHIKVVFSHTNFQQTTELWQFRLDWTELNWTDSQSHIATDGRSVSQSVSQSVSKSHLGLMTRYLLLFDSCGLIFSAAPSLTRGRVCILYMLLALASLESFSGPSPLGLVTIFYCLRFETYLFVASYDSQGHGGGIRTRLHTGLNWQLLLASPYIVSGRNTALKTSVA